jgi:hypothetical protein
MWVLVSCPRYQVYGDLQWTHIEHIFSETPDHKALLFVSGEDEDSVSNLYTVSLEGVTYMDVHQSRARCTLRLGDLANEHGNTAAAIEHWKVARPLFVRSSQTKDIAEIDSRLAHLENACEEGLMKLATLQPPTDGMSISQEDPVKVKVAQV